MTMVVAACGKGGVGKTSIVAVAAASLAGRRDVRALVIDADPSAGLSMALGIDFARTLDHVRRETIQGIRSGEGDKSDLAASLDYMLMEALHERGNLAFLSIGRPEEVGCYCSVNSLLREAVGLLAGRFDMTLIDAEAGIEQVNRNVLASIDRLLLISDLSVKGIRVAETIRDVAARSNSGVEAFLLLNRAGTEQEALDFGSRTRLNIVGWVPEDETIRGFDEEGRSFFELPECPATRAALRALSAVCAPIF